MELTPCSVTQPHRWTFFPQWHSHTLTNSKARLNIYQAPCAGSCCDRSQRWVQPYHKVLCLKSCLSQPCCAWPCVTPKSPPCCPVWGSLLGRERVPVWQQIWTQSWMEQDRRLPGSSSERHTATDEDAIMWLKLFIHFPLALHFFISKAFCPLLPFYTASSTALPDSSFLQVCVTREFYPSKSWASISKLLELDEDYQEKSPCNSNVGLRALHPARHWTDQTWVPWGQDHSDTQLVANVIILIIHGPFYIMQADKHHHLFALKKTVSQACLSPWRHMIFCI